MIESVLLDPSNIVLTVIILALGGVTAWKHGMAGVRRGVGNAWGLFTYIMKLVPFAMWAAILVAEVLPSDIIGGWIGETSGFGGLIVAGAAGGLVLSGPFVSFPIAIGLLHAGAGVPQLVAFLTGWSVLAIHRVFIMEIPLMGWRFAVVRLGSSVFLPLIAGATALVLWPMFSGN